MASATGPGEERRREIVDQAAALFDRRGYHGTSLEDVAASVGLRKASLYHYFRGKDDILAGVDSGAFRPMDPRMATLALFGACNWAYQWYRPSDQDEPREVAYALWDLLMRGVRAR